ncbi:MAG: aromatic amino acid transport family protein [Syntrophomonadaceae bacterium]|nr:aromatic amino acid transport family protein [Syntrophomonadaceae bacterium]
MDIIKPLIGGLLFAGTIIGAGILGLPFALAQGGFLLGSLLLLLAGFFAYLSAVQIGVLVYDQQEQLPLHSIIERYLGWRMSYLSLAAILFSTYGALIAYPLAIGEMVSTLFHLPAWLGAIVFITFITGFLSLNLKESNKIDATITLLLTMLLLWIVLRSLPQVRLDNLLAFHPSRIFSSFGVIIFAFAGHLVIPSVIYYMGVKRETGIKVLGWSIFAVGLLYLLFFTVSTGVMGSEINRVATLGLGKHLSPILAIAGQLFTVLAIITSFFGLAISLRMTLARQFKLKPYHSLSLILVPVLLIDLLLSANPGNAFVKVLNYAGGIGSALYIGFIPAMIMADKRFEFNIFLGRSGARLSLIFYGLAILYTVFFT